jgi:HK97 family phage prohead protease
MAKSSINGPRGWSPATISKRFADIRPSPSSFDEANRSVDAILSMGSPVARFYGTEVLRISPDAVGLDRMKGGSMIPLLDSHQAGGIASALGRVSRTWFKSGGLMGSLQFNQTPTGEMAMGMVQRGEIAGISAGYTVNRWEISDDEGNIIDDADSIRWDDNLTYTATKWDLHECSLVSVPADPLSGIRSGSGLDRAVPMIGGGDVDAVRARMGARMRMATRQRMLDAQGRVIGLRNE